MFMNNQSPITAAAETTCSTYPISYYVLFCVHFA